MAKTIGQASEVVLTSIVFDAESTYKVENLATWAAGMDAATQ